MPIVQVRSWVERWQRPLLPPIPFCTAEQNFGMGGTALWTPAKDKDKAAISLLSGAPLSSFFSAARVMDSSVYHLA
jgi:hypothetical protein